MFANLLQLLSKHPPKDHERKFVEEIRLVDHVPPRNRQVEKILFIGWILIAVKCALVVWLVGRYHMKLNPLWVNAPTVLFGLLCTAVYYARE